MDDEYGTVDSGEMKGVCRKWITGKGFGFIEFVPKEFRNDVFCHRTALEGGREFLNIGEHVTFFVEKDDRSGNKVMVL